MTEYEIYNIFINLLPLFLIGAVVGSINYISSENTNKQGKLKQFISVSSSAGILAIISYLISSEFDVSPNTQLGIAIFVAFAGYEKLHEIFDKVLQVAKTRTL